MTVVAGLSAAATYRAVGELMKKAGALFKDNKFGECAEIVAQAQQKIEALSATGDAIILKQLEPHYARLANAHAKLELEGLELAELMPLGKPKKVEKPAKPDKSKPAPTPSPAANGLSFVKHVVPVLIGLIAGAFQMLMNVRPPRRRAAIDRALPSAA